MRTINIYYGSQLRRSFAPLCPHEKIILQPLVIGNIEYVVTSCLECHEMNLRDPLTLQAVTTYKMMNLGSMCLGPQGILFAMQSMIGGKTVLGYAISTTGLNNTFSIRTNMEQIYAMCYLHYNSALVLTDWESNTIQAIDVNSGNIVWKITGVIDGKLCCPCGVVAMHTGEVVVADGTNGRLILLDGLTGELLGTETLVQFEAICGLHLLGNDSQLIVWGRYREKEVFAYYNITS